MLTTYSNSFRIATFWPELVNKKVQQVESHLKEIQYIPRDGYLVAFGTIKRHVRYLEFDGRARRAEDQIQFEVSIGKISEIGAELTGFTAELRQEFFMFQPRKLGESQALLEQGFELLSHQSEQTAPINQQLMPVLFETVVGRGHEETLVQLLVKFPEPVKQPKQFDGAVFFKPRPVLPVIEGEISGTLVYRSAHNILQEMEFAKEFGVLAKLPVLQGLQYVQVSGEVADLLWTPTELTQEWLLELQISYQWFILEEQELLYSVAESDTAITAELPVFDNRKRHKFSRDLQVNFDHELLEVSVETFSWERKIVRSGILVTADIELGILGLEKGIEAHQKKRISFDELMTWEESQQYPTEPLIKDDLLIQLTHRQETGGNIRIMITADYHCQIYRNQLVNLALDTKGGMKIRGQTLIDSNSFSLFQEAVFDLQTEPQSVERIKVANLELQPQTRKGWLAADGVLDLSIAYTDKLGFSHEDGFRYKFQQSFLWNKLAQTDRVRLQPRLEYDNFTVDQKIIKYRFLIILTTQLFREGELQIKLPVNDFQQSEIREPQNWRTPIAWATPFDLPKPSEPLILHFAMEGELPLKLGMPREIAKSYTNVEQFNFRTAHNAILVEGKLSGEIDYWDEDGYLRREPVNYPFWRFLTPELLEQLSQTATQKFVPEIRRFSFMPVRTWPWRKRSVRIAVEMEIRPQIDVGRPIA